MDEKTALCLVGFLFCLMGTVAFVLLNIPVAVFCLGLGLIIVGVVAGFIEELFEMFRGIFESIFER